MKTLLSFILLCSLILLSCRENGHIDSLLSNAEVILENNPDSALSMLDTVDTKILDRGRMAKYALLTSAAKYKCIIPQSDSLLQIALKYYKKYGNDSERLRTYYYLGGISDDNGKPLKSQEYLIQALKVGKNSKDYNILAKTYNQIGFLYLFQEAYEQAPPYFKNALHYYKLSNNKKGASYALQNMARTHSVLYSNPDSAIFYYKRALVNAPDRNKDAILGELASIYIAEKKYNEAYLYIKKALSISLDEKPYTLWLIYGQYLLKTGTLDSANIYLNRVLECPAVATKANAMYYLGTIAETKGEQGKSIEFYKIYMDYWDQEREEAKLNRIIKMDQLYNYQEAYNELNLSQLKVEKQRSMILGLTLLVVTIVSITIILYRRKQRLILEQRLRFSDWKNQQALKEKANINSLLKKEKTITDLEEQLSDFNHIKENLIKQKFEDSEIYQKFKNHTDIRLTEEDWNLLIREFNMVSDGFTNKLKAILPSISKKEIQLCCLVKLYFTPKDIAEILNASPSTISTNRKRLYEKIHGTKGSSTLFDNFIKGL